MVSKKVLFDEGVSPYVSPINSWACKHCGFVTKDRSQFNAELQICTFCIRDGVRG